MKKNGVINCSCRYKDRSRWTGKLICEASVCKQGKNLIGISWYYDTIGYANRRNINEILTYNIQYHMFNIQYGI